jgi:hypothetical protein
MTKTMKATAGRPGNAGPRAITLALVLLGSALFGGACNRQHLSPNFGLAYGAWFTAQHVRHEPADSEATRRALGSLDAQEAASVSKNYRKASAGGQGEAAGQAQMVMIGQARGGNDSYTPPPSVPGGN